MAKSHAHPESLVGLLQLRAETDQKINVLVRATGPELPTTLKLTLLVSLALVTDYQRHPTTREIGSIVTPAGVPGAILHYISKLTKLGYIDLTAVKGQPAIVVPTEKAYRATGQENPHIKVNQPLTRDQTVALEFIREHIKKHQVFPSQRDINSHLGRSYRGCTEIISALLRKKFLIKINGGYVLASD